MNIPYLTARGHKTALIVNGEPFIAMGGEVHNSDSSSPQYMEHIWQIADELGMNTLLLPVSWEMCEPEEGVFDFTVAQKLIIQARDHGKKIIFLWFGSWKNAECMYAPAWVKKDLNRFKRAQMVKGKNKAGRAAGKNIPIKIPYTTISYLCEEAMKSDARAFAKFMAFLKEYDEKENTVIAVQVENETGLLGAARENSDEADALFNSAVPEAFVRYMKEHTDTMVPDVKEAVLSGKECGSWKEVFGDVADEIFSGYHVARYVNHVAQAGKDIYPLPLLVNCWLDKGGIPGSYPSGGPVSRIHEVWDYCAKAIDIYCPDIYVPQFMEVCDEYVRRGNPLAIPEAATHSYCAPRLVYTVGHYHAICYSPFGFDDIGKPFTAIQGFLFGMDVSDSALKTPQNFEEYSRTAHLLANLIPLIGKKIGTNDLQATCGECGPVGMMQFEDLAITNGFKSQIQPRNDGYCLTLRSEPGVCYILANACNVLLSSPDKQLPNLDILKCEEGEFEDGIWKPQRRLNGDETASMIFNKPTLIRVEYFIYD